MDVLGDLVAADRRAETLCYERAGDRSRSYSYRKFCTSAWKAGNLLRHYGVREGMTVGVVDGPKDPQSPDDREGTPVPESLLTLFGATLLGATVRFDPPIEPDVRVLVGPAAWMDEYSLQPGSKALAFGGPPDDPTVAHFERELWSENPTRFPADVDPEAVALRTETDAFTHESLLDAARSVVAEHDIAGGDAVSIDAPLSDPGTVVAGVLAPVLAGGTITVGGEASLVVSGRASGEGVLDPETVRPAHSPGRT